MRARRLVPVGALAAALAAAGCSSSTVFVDYQPQTDFTAYHTWAWAVPPTGVSPQCRDPRVSPFTLERARPAVEAALARKGYTQAPADRADLKVAVFESYGRRIVSDPGYVGWGWGWGWGWGPTWGPSWGGYYSAPSVSTYDETILIVEIGEAKPSGRVLWRGVVRRPVDEGLAPEEQEARIRQMIDEVLAPFPPPPTR